MCVGKSGIYPLSTLLSGLNPTYAGKRRGYATTAHSTGAQPHLCGKECGWLGGTGALLGSTPPMRERGFLTRRYTCKMSENLSLFPCGVSRQCLSTVTFAPGSGCSGLDTLPGWVGYPFMMLSPSRRRADQLWWRCGCLFSEIGTANMCTRLFASCAGLENFTGGDAD